MANVKANQNSTWPCRGEIGSRLEPLAKPGFKPSFDLVAGERVFTIGSCFARNVENALEKCGFQLPTRAIIRVDPQFAQIGQNILNNYGVPSILNELRWALDPAYPFSEEMAFFEVTPGKFVDAHLNQAIRPAPIEVVRARRRAIQAAYQAIGDCRVIIMTLGLAECWYDRLTSTYLNTPPRRALIRVHGDRFELHVLGYEEVLAGLSETFDLIRRYGHPDHRVILTVSPVPLGATFRSDDVMSANSYSKAVLRTVAEVIALGNDRVDYYPSFESVMLSSRDAAFEDDLVHPTARMIELNTSRMIRAYVGADALGIESIHDAISQNPASALSLLGERQDLLASDPELARALFGAADRANRMDLLKLALEFVQSSVPDDEQSIARARIALEDGNAAEALTFLAEPPARRGARNIFWQTRLASRLKIGDFAAARLDARAWSEASPNTAQPFRMLAVAYAGAGMSVDAESMFAVAMHLSDDDPRLLLDYADFLDAESRLCELREVLAMVTPANPSQTDRLSKMQLWLLGENDEVRLEAQEKG
jgi:tetratricopeptide (TPR) repeat protein